MLRCVLLCVLTLTGMLCVDAEILDMTRTFDNNSRLWPAAHSPFQLRTLLSGIQPGGFWLQFEDIESGIHVGTHMDAPMHFCRDCWTVDQIPIERLVSRPAVVIDIREKASKSPDCGIKQEDAQAYEAKYGRIPAGSVVFMCSGWGDKYDDTVAYLGNDQSDTNNFHFPGYEVDGIKWLIENRGIYGIGTDGLSIDRGDADGFPAHIEYSKHNVYSLENVPKTCEIPFSGARVHVMPSKIRGASGGHTRVVATWGASASGAEQCSLSIPLIILTALLALMN